MDTMMLRYFSYNDPFIRENSYIDEIIREKVSRVVFNDSLAIKSVECSDSGSE